MEIRLDPMQGYVKDGKFDQEKGLISTGVKAAICYKEAIDGVAMSPEMVRELESDAVLLNRGIDTFCAEHTTPSEHQMISLEITGAPKIFLMVLNNEKQYCSDERSLRYTQVEDNKFITKLEVELYNKWLNKLEQIITDKYLDFYLKFSRTEKMARSTIHKLAQENARYMVSVFMPTTTTYTVPWVQINKLMSYMQKVINNPLDKLEEMLIPYFEEFIEKCKELGVAVTKKSIYEAVMQNDDYLELVSKKHLDIIQDKDNTNLFYKNSKDVDLSLFSKRNAFSGIDMKNEYGTSVSYNNYESFACLAHEHRHRSIDCEIKVPDEYMYFIPPILLDDESLVNEWKSDMEKVKDLFPQGQLIKVNRCMTLRSMLKFVSQERACDRAQLEIQRVYTDDIIPDVYEGLKENNKEELAEAVKPYVKRLRCAYPGYRCPGPCGHPRIKRDI